MFFRFRSAFESGAFDGTGVGEGDFGQSAELVELEEDLENGLVQAGGDDLAKLSPSGERAVDADEGNLCAAVGVIENVFGGAADGTGEFNVYLELGPTQDLQRIPEAELGLVICDGELTQLEGIEIESRLFEEVDDLSVFEGVIDELGILGAVSRAGVGVDDAADALGFVLVFLKHLRIDFLDLKIGKERFRIGVELPAKMLPLGGAAFGPYFLCLLQGVIQSLVEAELAAVRHCAALAPAVAIVVDTRNDRVICHMIRKPQIGEIHENFFTRK